MNIAYYMPFKPLGHGNPSGDLITGTELYLHLESLGHSMELASRLRCRWIYYKPFSLFKLLREQRRIAKKGLKQKPDIWLSYHSYYKAPDLLGPTSSKKLGIPYAIFQGIYSTKRRKKLKTLPGFHLNKQSLLTANHVFTNKRRDHTNLKRILPDDKLTFIAPGIHPKDFTFSNKWRDTIKQNLDCQGETIIMTAAMMRPGVKTEGIKTVIDSCINLIQRGQKIQLIIAGDGENRRQLEKQASSVVGLKVHFLGKIPRHELYRYYSAADIFAFPGIEESLGMVYLEAQSCRTPVIAYSNWGGGEAVVHNKTGLISPASEPNLFTKNIEKLIVQQELRQTLGDNGCRHIQKHHNIKSNYKLLENTLYNLTRINQNF